MFDPLFAAAIVAFGSFTYHQFIAFQISLSEKQWYQSKAKRVFLAPPTWLYGVVWPILYGIMTATIVLFVYNAHPTKYNLPLAFSMYIIHMLANKLWSLLFWKLEQRSNAFALIVLVMIPSLIVFLLMLVVNGEFHLVPLIFTSIYMTWLLFAAYLNFQFM